MGRFLLWTVVVVVILFLVYALLTWPFQFLGIVVGIVAIGAIIWAIVHIADRQKPENIARRALERGDLIQALRVEMQAGDDDAVIHMLENRLPAWPIRADLVCAARELLQLRKGAASARKYGVPSGFADSVSRQAEAATEALFRSVGRVVSVHEQQIDYKDIENTLKRESSKLADLTEAIRQARIGLAELTMSDRGTEGLDRVQLKLRALGDAAREIA